jgi:hypothetical protein
MSSHIYHTLTLTTLHIRVYFLLNIRNPLLCLFCLRGHGTVPSRIYHAILAHYTFLFAGGVFPIYQPSPGALGEPRLGTRVVYHIGHRSSCFRSCPGKWEEVHLNGFKRSRRN